MTLTAIQSGDDERTNVLSGPPHNLEAEQAVLGAVMFDNGAMERLSDKLRPEHFFEPFHQRLFGVIGEHIGKGLLAEPVVLMERFKRDPAFEDLGGLRYLANLMNMAPPAAHAFDYGQVVYDLALRRNMIRVGGDLAKAANDERETAASEIVERAEGELYAMVETSGQRGGGVTFAEAVASAVSVVAEACDRGGLAGLSTGLLDLDRKLGGLFPSDLIILGGRPSQGKTALATNIAFNVARAYRWEPQSDGSRKTVAGGIVQFFSLEMSADQLAMRLLGSSSGVPSDRMRRGDVKPMEFGQVRDAALEIGEIPLFIDDRGGLPIAKLCATARRQKRRSGLDLIVVDYLQLITPSNGRASSNRVTDVTEITIALKALAKELGVPVIALSQLSRKVEEREDKRPQLSDLRESGSIEQDADVVMFVYREAYYEARKEPREGTSEHLAWQEKMDACRHEADLIIGKQRHGPIGTVKLSFNEDLTHFGNLAREAKPGIDFSALRHPYGDV